MITNLFLGGLYLIWCDIDIVTSSVETLILVLVYVFFFKNFVADYCHCIEAISVGKASLEKLKVRKYLSEIITYEDFVISKSETELMNKSQTKLHSAILRYIVKKKS
jgi:hypothetical protein